jgi:hypothetical protein
MSANEEVLENMDKAAEVAEEELKDIPIDTVIFVANWWKKHYLKAGHKRLAKILLKYAPKKESY